jgi:hypothetical protein
VTGGLGGGAGTDWLADDPDDGTGAGAVVGGEVLAVLWLVCVAACPGSALLT